jgi:hypothetical protein
MPSSMSASLLQAIRLNPFLPRAFFQPNVPCPISIVPWRMSDWSASCAKRTLRQVDAEWCTSPAIALMSRPASRSLACADYRPVSWLVLWTGIWARSGLANKARLQA